MKCPRCGYDIDAPKPEPPPYEYTGYLKPHLPMMLKMLRTGHSNRQVADTLVNLYGVHSYWGVAPSAGIIGYIGRRYGIESKKTVAGKPDRNDEIAAKYLAGGVTLKKLGEEYGLSPARIRVIVARAERTAARREETERVSHAAARIEDVPIEALNLSVRAANCFKNEGCQTVGDVLKLSDAEMLCVPNFGRVSRDEWKQALEALRSEFAKRDRPALADFQTQGENKC